MARTATSTILIKANPVGLTMSTDTPITLYKGAYSNNSPISPLEVNETSLTVQNLVEGICIPSGVITSDINQIDVFFGDICQTYETIHLEQITTPTPTPTSTPTPTPTVGAFTPTPTPTPRPTSTPTPTLYRTAGAPSANTICCDAATAAIYFDYLNAFGLPYPGSRAYTNPALTSVFNGGGLFYGVLDYYNQAAETFIYISSNGFVGATGDCSC